jgi:hypothetical protein
MAQPESSAVVTRPFAQGRRDRRASGCGNRPTEDTAMTGKKAAKETKPSTVVANDPDDLKGTLKNIGGSRSDHWNNILANQTVQALWLKHSDPETREKQFTAVIAALIGIGPEDELEGMRQRLIFRTFLTFSSVKSGHEN